MEIKTPDLGVESAEVSEILVEVGDTISENDDIVLLESDKAAVEVPSSASGKVTKIVVAVGDTVSEGSVLIELEAGSGSADDSESDSSDESESGADTAKAPEADDSQEDSQANNQESNTESTDEGDTSNEVSASSESAESATYGLPDLGVDEAEVAEVMVKVGDTVEADQSLILVESDKASVEVPSPASGTVEEILVAAGDSVANGQDFIVIKGSGGSASKATESQSKKSNETAPKASDKKAEKTETKASDNKDTSTKAASADSKKSAAASQGSQKKLSESQVNEKLTDIYAGPAVRKLARQLGVDITRVEGSALNSRIIKEDVFDYVKSHMTGSTGSAPAAANAVSSGLPVLPDMSKEDIWGEIETQDLSRLQKVSIPQLNYNTYLPQVTQFDLSDITETEKLRKALKPEFKSEGIGLTILAFIVKATAYALMQHPKFNSHLSDDNTQIHVRKTVNMGIAVATDDGLIVPVIKDAQTKGIKQIAIEIGELAAKARDKKLTAKDLQGASFTISSQGNLGGTYFTPLVNWPQVGILGISEATMQPRWDDETAQFKPRLMLPLSLSYDHRVINGADAAVFTRYIAKLLADPRRILL